MKNCVMLAMAVALTLLASPCFAARYGAAAQRPARAAPAKTELYSVIQIGEEIKAIPKSQLLAEKKRVADDYKRDMKAYEEAKKAAAKSKEKSEVAKPVKLTIKILKSPLKSEEEAKAWIESHSQGKEGAGNTSKSTAAR